MIRLHDGAEDGEEKLKLKMTRPHESTDEFPISEDDCDFEIPLPNLAYRSLRIQEGQLM
jgi:hypothetical protein